MKAFAIYGKDNTEESDSDDEAVVLENEAKEDFFIND
jgi:hypothetical protein